MSKVSWASEDEQEIMSKITWASEDEQEITSKATWASEDEQEITSKITWASEDEQEIMSKVTWASEDEQEIMSKVTEITSKVTWASEDQQMKVVCESTNHIETPVTTYKVQGACCMFVGGSMYGSWGSVCPTMTTQTSFSYHNRAQRWLHNSLPRQHIRRARYHRGH